MAIITSPAARAPRALQSLSRPFRPTLGPILEALEQQAVRVLHQWIAARLARECSSPVRPLSRRGRWDWA